MLMLPEERGTTPQQLKDQIDAAVGRVPADLLVTNVKVLDVFTETIFDGAVLIKHGKIVNIDPGFTPEAAQVFDGGGRYLIPGFIDPCTHIDCSLVMPSELSEGYVPWGTTTVVAEVNDLAAAQGSRCVEAVKAYFKDRDKLPYRLLALAPGKGVDKAHTYELLDWNQISGQGENLGPSTLAAHPDTLEKVLNTRRREIFLNGDVEPFSTPDEIGAFAVCGSVNDHEAWTYDAVFHRHRRGIPTQILHQQGEEQLRYMVQELILNRKLPSENFMFAGDNTYIDDMVNTGILNDMVTRAIRLGLPPVKAIKMATINTARNLGLDQLLGSVAPGRYADFMLVDDLYHIRPSAVFKGGELVAQDGKLLVKPQIDYSFFRQSWRSDLSQAGAEELFSAYEEKDAPRSPDGTRCQVEVISLNLDGSDGKDALRIFPDGSCLLKKWLPVVDDRVQADPEQDVLKVLLVGREEMDGKRRLARCYVKGYGFQGAALSMTNLACGNCILVMGSDEEEMLAALREVDRYPGAVAVSANQTIEEVYPLAYAGMIGDQDGRQAAEALNRLTDRLKARGCQVPQLLVHFWTLAFACHDADSGDRPLKFTCI